MMHTVRLKQIGYQKVTVTSSAAVALTVPFGTAHVLLRPATGDEVLWRADGTAPTTTTGMPLSTDLFVEYCGEFAGAFRAISASGSKTLHVAYFSG